MFYGIRSLFCAAAVLIGMTQLANGQTSEAELLDGQRKMLEAMGQLTAGPAFSSSGVFGMLADLKAERDQAVTGQVEKLDIAVREVLDIAETDEKRAKVLALSIIWVPVGDEETDSRMSTHYNGLREALLETIQG